MKILGSLYANSSDPAKRDIAKVGSFTVIKPSQGIQKGGERMGSFFVVANMAKLSPIIDFWNVGLKVCCFRLLRNNGIFVIVATLEEGDRTVPWWCRSLDRAGPDLGAAGCTGSLPYTNVRLYSALWNLCNGKLNLKAWTYIVNN